MQALNTADLEPSSQDFAVLAQVIRDVGRRGRLSADDALDFGQSVHLALVESGYRAIRCFSGKSSLRTYLTVVVHRLLLDWRRRELGKWHSSAAAKRLGPAAEELETLIRRNGHTREEAIEILRSRQRCGDPDALWRMADELPARHARRMVPVECLDQIRVAHFDDPLEQRDRQRLRRRLAAALRQLGAEDRRLLDLRYRREVGVATMARSLATDPKALYRRFDRSLRRLRALLEKHP